MNCSTQLCISKLLSTVINTYLFNPIQLQNNTVCLVWDDFDFDPDFTLLGQFVILRSSESKYVNEAIGKTFCERYVVLGNIVIPFLNTLVKSIIEVNWRAAQNAMVLVGLNFSEELLSHRIVKEIPDILFLKIKESCSVEAYTSKYVSLYSNEPEELYLLDTFNGTNFQKGVNLFPNKKQNFKGRVVRLGLFEYLPFSVLFEDPKNGNAFVNNSGRIDKYFLDGVEGRVLVTYCQVHNCSIEIIRVNYGEWGTVYSNLSGDGQIGLVVENKADIAFNAIYLWDDIYPYGGMSRFMSRSGVTFLIPGPKILDSWLLPLHPFSDAVWIGVIVCFFLEAFSIAVIQYNELLIHAPNRLFKSLTFGIMSTYQIYCSQIIADNMEMTPKRVIFISCFVIDFIITGAYTGALATILTVPLFSDVADTMSKMIDFGLQFGAISDVWVISLMESEEPKTKSLMNLYKTYTNDEMVNLTSNATIGVILEQLTHGLISTPKYMSRENSKLYTISSEEAYFGLCISFVSKAWVHMKNYNQIISRIQESGLPRMWEWQMGVKYMDDVIQNTLRFSSRNFEEDGPVSLGMSNCSGMFVILYLGLTLSSLVFLVEILVGSKKYVVKRKRCW